jgi:phage baseplate assembly protein W
MAEILTRYPFRFASLALRERVDALFTTLEDQVSPAVDAHLNGLSASIDYNYAALAGLAGECRDILASLTAAYSWDLVPAVELLRNVQRWLYRLYASPELFNTTLEGLAADYAARGGKADLASIVRRQLKQYMVVEGDSLPSIAQSQLGDATRWPEIAMLNGLSYPYLSDDLTYSAAQRAVGEVTFSHVSALEASWLIPVGTIVGTRATADRPAILFRVTQDATIPAGELSVTVPVEALETGEAGNIGPGEIYEVVWCATAAAEYLYELEITAVDVAGNSATTTRTFRHVGWPGATNAEAMREGASGSVARKGEWILLPVAASVRQVPGIFLAPVGANPLVRQYGIDYWMSEEGGLDRDNTGDIKAVGGLDNLVIAMRCALSTERGDLTGHPEYGSDLWRLVGELESPYRADRVALEVSRAALRDPRIRDVRVLSTEWDVQGLRVGLEFTTENTQDTGRVNLVLRNA